MGAITDEIERRLRASLAPTVLHVADDSDKHIGHSGHDAAGESHFTVEIESAVFEGLSRVERQRAVNRALGELMHQRVHALAMTCRAPGEA